MPVMNATSAIPEAHGVFLVVGQKPVEQEFPRSVGAQRGFDFRPCRLRGSRWQRPACRRDRKSSPKNDAVRRRNGVMRDSDGGALDLDAGSAVNSAAALSAPGTVATT